MTSYYEFKNLILSREYSKSRKLKKLLTFRGTSEVTPSNYTRVMEEILDGETEDQVLARFEDDEAQHWIQHYSNKVAADLLTLGKVQPETMLAISLLPDSDFAEIVKLAATRANKINSMTLNIEQDIQVNTVSPDII